MSKHILIGGTGRAGTTFLVKLFTRLGYDTGYDYEDIDNYIHEEGQCGLEQGLRNPNKPYIVKDPWAADYLDQMMPNNVTLDYAIIPIRDLYAAAESRRRLGRMNEEYGGLVWTESLEEGVQEAILAEKFYTLMHTLAKYNVPVILLEFPRLVKNPSYLFRKLVPIIEPVEERFLDAFRDVAQPELVHDFTRTDSKS